MSGECRSEYTLMQDQQLDLILMQRQIFRKKRDYIKGVCATFVFLSCSPFFFFFCDCMFSPVRLSFFLALSQKCEMEKKAVLFYQSEE